MSSTSVLAKHFSLLVARATVLEKPQLKRYRHVLLANPNVELASKVVQANC